MMEYVYCIHCKKKWSKEEVTRYLNATEALSAEDAKWIYNMDGGRSLLLDYARILEGEDE
jgi:hypothetical protein